MSNKIQNYEKYARALSITLVELDEFSKRGMGYLSTKPLNNRTLKEMLFILLDIQNRSAKETAKKWKTANKELRENGAKIAIFRNEGAGYGTVKKELELKASITSIKNFCKDNNLVKGEK